MPSEFKVKLDYGFAGDIASKLEKLASMEWANGEPLANEGTLEMARELRSAMISQYEANRIAKDNEDADDAQ